MPPPLLGWVDAVGADAGTTITQRSPGVHRRGDRDDWASDPGVSEHRWNGSGGWIRLDDGGEPVDVSGRLIGGCIETLANLAGTPYGDTGLLRRLAGTGVPEPLIVYVEAADDDAFSICRNLHGMRLAGFFDGAAAILVGRTAAPDSPSLTQADAVRDALGPLGIPIIGDVDFGHVPPQMSIVNGAWGRLTTSGDGSAGELIHVLA